MDRRNAHTAARLFASMTVASSVGAAQQGYSFATSSAPMMLMRLYFNRGQNHDKTLALDGTPGSASMLPGYVRLLRFASVIYGDRGYEPQFVSRDLRVSSSEILEVLVYCLPLRKEFIQAGN
jgi:hypothetical protein